jgi:hypothetical protein
LGYHLVLLHLVLGSHQQFPHFLLGLLFLRKNLLVQMVILLLNGVYFLGELIHVVVQGVILFLAFYEGIRDFI